MSDHGSRIRVASYQLKEHGHAASYAEIAGALGISESYLNNVRRREKDVSEEQADGWLSKMCEAFKVTPEQLGALPPSVPEGVGAAGEHNRVAVEVAAAEGSPQASGPSGSVKEADSRIDERASVPPSETDDSPIIAEDQIGLKHGKVFFIANRAEGGLWDIEARVSDDEVVRLLAMSVYREMFGGWVNGNGDEPDDEDDE